MDITVIIPVYNAKNYLQKAVESALQFEEVKELILVEDGCPYGSLERCEELQLTDSRIKLFQHENGVNKGAGASRNLGIEKATQEYIAFLDADDFYLPNRFEKENEIFLNNNEVEGIYNPINSHFYSEKARLQRAQFINVAVEDLEKYDKTGIRKNDVKPTELYKGLLYLIPNFGHFSVIGLTVKRVALNKMQKPIYMEGSFYEDKEFIIKLAYHCYLVPGNTLVVAKRGVHEENRITKHTEDNQKHYLNKYKYFSSLKKWSHQVNLQDRDVVNLININYAFFDILNTDNRIIKVVKLLKNPIVFFTNHYKLIHKNIFGSQNSNQLSYRIITKFLSYFKAKYVFAKRYYIAL